MTKDRTFILQFIDSTRFMTRSLSNLVNNLSEVLHSMKCKLGHYDIEYKTCVIKCKYCDCFLEYAKFKDDFIEYCNFLQLLFLRELQRLAIFQYFLLNKQIVS